MLIEGADRQDPVDAKPFSDAFFDDPYDVHRQLREEAPVLSRVG